MQKTKVIFIYGAPAVGKLTTAEVLAKQIDYKLLHNHLTTDLVRAVFDRGNEKGDMLIVKLRFEILEIAVKEKVKGVVMTGVYARDFVYPNGETDEWFAKQIESLTLENGGEFYGVHLVAPEDTLLSRVVQEDRRRWRKISAEDVLKEVLGKYDFSQSASVENNIVINNKDLSVEQVVEKIIEFVFSEKSS